MSQLDQFRNLIMSAVSGHASSSIIQDRITRYRAIQTMFYDDNPGGDSLSEISITGNRIVDETVSALFTHDPVVNVTDYSGEPMENRTQIICKVFEVEDMSSVFGIALSTAFYAFGCLRMHPLIEKMSPDDEVGTLRIKASVVDPLSVIAYPSFVPEFDRCSVILEKVERTKAEIDRLISEGVYKNLQVVASSEGFEDQVATLPASRPDTSSGEGGAERVTLYAGVMRDSKSRKWFDVVCNQDATIIYKLNEAAVQICPFIKVRLVRPRLNDGIYDSVSPGNNMQRAQNLINASYKNWQRSAALNSNPPIKTDDQTVEQKMAQGVQPGLVLFSTDKGLTQPLIPPPDMSYQFPMIKEAKDYLQRVASVSQIDQGAAIEGSQTATEVNQIQAGAQVGQDQYIRYASKAVEAIAAYIDQAMALFLANGIDWIEDYIAPEDEGEWLEDYNAEHSYPATIKCSVTNAQMTPGARVGKLQSLFDMAANVPQSGLNIRKIAEALTKTIGQMGVGNTDEFLEDPIQQAFAAIGEATGLDPDTIRSLLESALTQAGGGVGEPQGAYGEGEGEVPGYGAQQWEG